ncbi:sensor domain-containing diguanylate cyclase [Desulfogranum mediterraneum]|uniref:sensor domain-containing diguanylate cyclase n=1 Tax=Desulfogranum mediterraneum TaxID=160661 RepID=UPI00041897E9|nr:GGDEF domain-containing protein [Desulfogranum mediterraneum]
MSTLEDFFSEKIQLPSPPAIALQILKAVRQEESSFADLAEIIRADPALTARILKVANSSLYGLPREISSLTQATSLLGTDTLKNIALSFVIVEGLNSVHQAGFNLELFWKRAISTAVAAESLSTAMGYRDQDLFISALLQDIGVLIMFLSDGVGFSQILDLKRINGQPLCAAEQQHFGFDHAQLGARLLQQWDFPAGIVEPIRSHHAPSRGEHQQAASILSIADKIGSIYHGNQSNRKSIEVQQELMAGSRLESSQITELIDGVGERSREIMELFSFDPGEMKPFSLLMQEANEELRQLNFSYEQVVLELKQAKQSAEQLAVDLKEANDKLRELAFRDDLTGLYNHRYFQEVLEKELQRCHRYDHPLALIMLDIDYFKQINDTYGHPVGDRVLKEVGQRMVELVRKVDIVARYGGEEFAIILPEIGSSGARVLAQRIRRGVEQYRTRIGQQEIAVTVSIGLAASDNCGAELGRAGLIAQSDQALYTAKRSGRNRVEG